MVGSALEDIGLVSQDFQDVSFCWVWHTCNAVAHREIEDKQDMADHPLTPPSVSSNQPHDQMVQDIIVDIEAILHESEGNLWSTESSSCCCIYRVPQALHQQNREAYTPKIVSIGPFHYGNPRLQNMETHKHIFFKRFAERVKETLTLEELVRFVEKSEPRVRACYSEKNIKLSKKELVKVMLMDGSFIIELFYGFGSLNFDPNLKKPWLMNTIIIDLILLENQLPFFFLDELFNLSFPSYVPSFTKLTFNFFTYFNRQNLEPNPNINVAIKHFTDLLRTFHLQSFGKPHRQWFVLPGNHVLLYSARKLHEAGVKLKANINENCLLNLKFSKGVFEIPQVMVEDNTETMFRNMIAFEQCHYPYESYITDYALLLDCLIDTSEDVDVLVHKGIICNCLADSNDVAKLFNGLWKNVTQMNFNSDYFEICKKLNGFCSDPWNGKKATLRRDYCKTPWQIAASIAGILLLLLTLVQTICSVIQVAQA
ncbi:UPF0481 protein [Senna tora]|uniref:UPF0481 protein n=1 Tax=Senna tora TaxID=362788 RepID=A0A834WSE4_9FABA|nr:UPF0481 protein [Senna tora]